MLDETEFLSPFGIRSLSRYHREHAYIVHVQGSEYRVDYLPAESNSGLFGGNSNWRGPIWFPMNYMLIRGLIQHAYYSQDFTVECPTGSGQQMTLWQVSQAIAARLVGIFLRDENGHRPVYGGIAKFQQDPYWSNHILFHEYFHGDSGAGLVARLIHLYSSVADFETDFRSAMVYGHRGA